MTCEWVEEQLSAYHDGMLDAATTEQVRAHLATCERCSAVLADYARFDHVLAHLPRYTPAPELRDRIFSSPAFREIVRGSPDAASPSAPAAPQAPVSSARLLPHAARVWLTVLALIIVVSGGTIALQGIMAARNTGPVYAACPQALSAGPRLVYRVENHLFSNSDKLICEARTQAGALWQVSPDGQWIAYTDATTNTLRLVRSDAMGDHEVDSSASAIVALSWSPDSQNLLIVKRGGLGGNSLPVYHLGVRDRSPTLIAEGVAAQLEDGPVFSPDGQSVAVAFGTPDGRNHSIMVLGTRASYLQNTATTARENTGLLSANAVISDLAWTAGVDPRLTWRAGEIDAIARSAISTQGTEQSNATVLAKGAFTAAAFSPAGGKWAIATADGTIIQVDAATQQQTPLAHLGSVTSLAWSPDGRRIAAASNGTLWLVSATGATKAGAIDAGSNPTWSSDSARLAFESAGVAQVYDLDTGKAHAAQAASVGSITGMAWSLENSRLAIWGSQGIVLDDATGTTLVTLSSPPAEPPQWSRV